MSHRYHRRHQRRTSGSFHVGSAADRQRADAVVRTIGAAEALPFRRRHYANTANGLKVTVRSNRSRDEVLDALRAKAGGDAIVEYWHNGGDAAELALSREAQRLPVERYRAALLAAPRPGGVEAPAGAGNAAMQSFLAMVQAQAAQPGEAGQQALLTMAPVMAMLAQQSGAQAGNEPEHGYARITDRVDRYLSYLEQRETTRLSIDGALHSLYLFVGVNGNLFLRDVKRVHCDEFIAALGVWPRNASKRSDYRDMGVAEVIQKAKRLRDQAIDTRTQQKHVERMRSFFSWCENREEVRPNLLYRVRLNPQARNKERKQHRRPFEPSELQSIFAPDRIRQASTPFQFWMPLMGYYTGARVNELAQLYVDDIIQVNGRWFFDIAMDRPGQRIKSIAARRLIPVHPHLLELGLLVFVQQAKFWKRSRLFPDVIWGRNGPGETVSRWFARLVKELEFPAHQTFHAFRNTFVMHAAAANILQEKYSELTGHAVNGSNVITTFYLRTQDAAERSAIYDRIKFPMIAHAPYEPAKFERIFRRASAVEQHEERLREAFGDEEGRA